MPDESLLEFCLENNLLAWIAYPSFGLVAYQCHLDKVDVNWSRTGNRVRLSEKSIFQ